MKEYLFIALLFLHDTTTPTYTTQQQLDQELYTYIEENLLKFKNITLTQLPTITQEINQASKDLVTIIEHAEKEEQKPDKRNQYAFLKKVILEFNLYNPIGSLHNAQKGFQVLPIKTQSLIKKHLTTTSKLLLRI